MPNGTRIYDESGNPITATNPLSVSSTSELTMLLDYSGGMLVIYAGEAAPGTAAGSALWRIKKLSYDANNNVTSVKWADGVCTYIKIWNNRAGYTYS